MEETELTYEEIIDAKFEPIFERFCKQKNVDDERAIKVKAFCRFFFELGALAFEVDK